jgi:hypothetical protein
MIKPRYIVPLIKPKEAAAAIQPAPTAHLTYHGGPLISAVEVRAIFWGSAWKENPNSDLIPQLGNFFDFILQSSLMDVLAQYGVAGKPIGHGKYLGPVVTTGPALGDTVSDDEIQQALQGWIENSTIPKPNANSLSFVYLPPGVVSSDGTAQSCTEFCGYHSHINGQIFYAVEPFLDCDGCKAGTGIFDSLTKVSSHELCEAITDPALSGWFDDNGGNEIGDICNENIVTLGGFVIQSEWSNAKNACRIAP